MARATKILNKYEIKLLALSDRDINYDNFYKEELIAFCKCLKEEYKKQKEVIDNINLIIKGLAYGGSEDYYMEKFSKINELLKEVSE